MARSFAITYGSYVIGSSGTDSEVRLTDKVSIDQGYTDVTVSFDVIVLASSVTAFHTVEGDLTAAYTKPDQDLTVAVGGNTRYTFSQSSNTGFNARPSIEKLGGVEDTDRSARYRLRVTMGLPADLSGKEGRQSSSVGVSVDPAGIRTVTISGVYTALSSNSARAQYEASVATYVASVKSALSVADWEQIGAPVEEDDDNGKVLRFTKVYREIFRNQGVGAVDVSGIINPRLRIRRTDTATNDTTELGQTEPLRRLSLSYTCFVNKSVSTDLPTFYTNTVRPHLINEANTVAETSVIVVDESPNFDLDANRIYVDMDLQADTGSALLAASVETEDVVSNGEVRFVVWSGDPFHRDVYQGPKTHIRRIRKSVLRRAGTDASLASDAPTGFRENSLVRKVQTRTLGRPGDATLDLEFVVVSQEFERVNSVTSAVEFVQEAAERFIGKISDFKNSFLGINP